MDKEDFYIRQANQLLNKNKSMRYSSSSGGCGGILLALTAMLGVWAFNLALWIGAAGILAFWTDRNLDFWVSHVKETPVDVPFVLSWAASLPLPVTFVANIIGEIGRYFL